MYDEHAERAWRLEILQRAESEFGPVPFDAEAAVARPPVPREKPADDQHP